MFEEAADFIRQVALIFGEAIPAVVVIERPPATDDFSNWWPVISAVAAAITAVWAGLSWSVSRQLAAIEQRRHDREKARLILYKDPEEDNVYNIGFLYNDGTSSTRIISAHIESMQKIRIVSVKVEVSLTSKGIKTIEPGDSVSLKFFRNNAQKVRDDGFNGDCLLVIKAVHQNKPIVMNINMPKYVSG